MSYRTVYDVTEARPDWLFTVVGVVLILVGAVLWSFRNHPGLLPGRAALRRIFAGFFLGFSIFWTIVVTVATFVSRHRAERALRDGSARVVEGPVENFHPMPYSGHDTERFDVGGVHFEYSDYEITSGFNQTSSHGGPVRAGLDVRIHYCGSPRSWTIVKLEVKP